MFAKLSTLALLIPFASALTINPLVGATTGGTVTVSWTASTTDAAYFSIELVNSAFHNTFAIANNVQTSLGQITILLPQVPVTDGYSLEAIATNNVNQVYSQSGTFSIGAATSSSASSPSTTSTPATTAGSTSSASVSTPLATATTPASAISSLATTATTSSAASTPSTFNSSGAAAFKVVGIAPAVALVLSAVAGAAMVF